MHAKVIKWEPKLKSEVNVSFAFDTRVANITVFEHVTQQHILQKDERIVALTLEPENQPWHVVRAQSKLGFDEKHLQTL